MIYIVKSLKTLSLETLTTKCKKDTYEELIDFDLMEKCCDGRLLQSCTTSSEFICNYCLELEYSRYKKIKITDLSPFCFICKFLQSCEYKKWGHNSKTEPFCDFCLLDRDMTMFSYDFFELDKSSEIPKIFHTFTLFYRIISYWNRVSKRAVNEYFEVLHLNKHVCKHFRSIDSPNLHWLSTWANFSSFFFEGGWEEYVIEMATSSYWRLT